MKKIKKLTDLGEIKLIKFIKKWLNNDYLGDDCAVLEIKKNFKKVLVTTDVLIEGVHFNLKNSSWKAIGFKAIAVNVSDISAMGGQPKFALVSLGLKSDLSFSDFKKIYDGFKEAEKFFGLKIVGGNLSKSQFNFIDVFMIGVPAGKTILKRNNIRPGDRLFLTGSLGKAVLKNYQVKISDFKKIRLKEGIFMAKNNLAHSAIDLSDGLLKALEDLVSGSDYGVKIFAEKLPLIRGVSLNKVLTFGDDFELLFVISPSKIDLALKKFNKVFTTGLTEIGLITQNPGIHFLNFGREIKPPTSNFRHF